LTSLEEEISSKVLNRINPNESERKKVRLLVEKLTKDLRKILKRKGIKAKIRLEGSVAKNTWLKDCPEIDLFLQVPITLPKEAFGTVILDITKKVTDGYKQIERFAEHPYLEAIINDIYVNLVPCYDVKSGEWISATDRTPFHTDYVNKYLDEKKKNEVRLLKRFMKGVGVYGAEIKIGGFSGYLCELLVIKYGTFIEVLRSAGNWEERPVIDIEGYYEKKEEIKKSFVETIIVVDPVDKGRNVAAAVRKERLDDFIAASREYLKNPDIKFFYPDEIEAFSGEELVKKINIRGSTMVFIGFEEMEPVPDVLWGQLFRSHRALKKFIEQNDFKILNSGVWSDEIRAHMFVFELENRCLPNIKYHLGPPLQKIKECEKFLLKYLGSDFAVSGPRIENGRWVVDLKRDFTDVIDLLKEKVLNNRNGIGLAEIVSKAVDSLKIFVNEEVLSFYSVSPEFARFLTDYIKGRPNWLT
jgi:tRNA nucleotidyltransferase (CCA-adding enzyme)